MGYDARGSYLGQLASPVYSFDAENRMVKAVSYTYAYDPLGRRTQKVIGAVTTNFVHDGDTEIADYDGTGALIRRFVPGPAVDDHIAMITCSGSGCSTQTKTFFHTDKMGSVIAMSDTGGNLAEGPYVYDGYGACTAGGGTCSGGVPFRYTGQRFDSETSFYYYRARLYAPLFGRFIQADPIGYKDDLNLYTYVGNDPTDKVDPKGEIAISCNISVINVVRKRRRGHANCSSSDDGRSDATVTYNVTFNNNDASGWHTSRVSFQTVVPTIFGLPFGLHDTVQNQIREFLPGATLHQDSALEGSLNVAAAVASLKLLHSEEAMRGNLSSRNFWSKKSTEEIKDSLRPGQRDSLKVKEDGTVMDGNTRLRILRERGVDIDSLPREPYP